MVRPSRAQQRSRTKAISARGSCHRHCHSGLGDLLVAPAFAAADLGLAPGGPRGDHRHANSSPRSCPAAYGVEEQSRGCAAADGRARTRIRWRRSHAEPNPPSRPRPGAPVAPGALAAPGESHRSQDLTLVPTIAAGRVAVAGRVLSAAQLARARTLAAAPPGRAELPLEAAAIELWKRVLSAPEAAYSLEPGALASLWEVRSPRGAKHARARATASPPLRRAACTHTPDRPLPRTLPATQRRLRVRLMAQHRRALPHPNKAGRDGTGGVTSREPALPHLPSTPLEEGPPGPSANPSLLSCPSLPRCAARRRWSSAMAGRGATVRRLRRARQC